MNNVQVGRGTDDTESVEIRSGDVLQFGVDVTENSKKGKVFVRFQLENEISTRLKKFWLFCTKNDSSLYCFKFTVNVFWVKISIFRYTLLEANESF